jgi:hypothetical protein
VFVAAATTAGEMGSLFLSTYDQLASYIKGTWTVKPCKQPVRYNPFLDIFNLFTLVGYNYFQLAQFSKCSVQS